MTCQNHFLCLYFNSAVNLKFQVQSLNMKFIDAARATLIKKYYFKEKRKELIHNHYYYTQSDIIVLRVYLKHHKSTCNKNTSPFFVSLLITALRLQHIKTSFMVIFLCHSTYSNKYHRVHLLLLLSVQ